MAEPLLKTVKQAAERLGVTPSAVYAMVESGVIEHHRIRCRPGTRGRIRFTEAQIQAYLDASKVTGGRAKPPAPATGGVFTHLDAGRLAAAWKGQGAG